MEDLIREWMNAIKAGRFSNVYSERRCSFSLPAISVVERRRHFYPPGQVPKSYRLKGKEGLPSVESQIPKRGGRQTIGSEKKTPKRKEVTMNRLFFFNVSQSCTSSLSLIHLCLSIAK